LLGGDLGQVRTLSASLTSAMKDLADTVHTTNDWHLVFSGGDDICITVESSAYREELIRELMRLFNKRTGGSMSFGVGESIESAYINLGLSPWLRQTVKTLLTVRCKFIVPDPGTDLGWACR
jgi:hypothetical protein